MTDQEVTEARPGKRRWPVIASGIVAVALVGAGVTVANADVVPGRTGNARPSHATAGATTATTTAAATTTATTTATTAGVSDVVTAADAFTATLSTTQQASVLLDFTEANATAWSNLPCGSSCRVGIQFSTLSTAQLTAAEAVLAAATGTGTGTGFDQISQILAADDVLGETASGYSSGNYFLAFLGTPSTTGTWQLHFGGHHLAVNITYVDGEVAGASPYFVGVEPKSWTEDGTTYEPLAEQSDGVLAVLSSLSSTQLASAKLSQTFSDVLLGPDEDGQFPSTKAGLAVSGLSDTQKALVLTAIEAWVEVADDDTAASLLDTYSSELDETYIAYSGNTTLTAQGDYFRIDGPSVWVEFVCQNGVVYSSQIHYHSVYRDHTRGVSRKRCNSIF
ncbi:DUF3500 domain-containing protein [Actinoplanes sp. NPDC051851]|uniref:DUF3500 domain-containing protein n=1 Tax=Actinoplanes sp. NPDC051851 TaxID=3154753 RepID=UPI0034154F6D